MSEVLKAKPVSVQVKHRGAFVPPRYNLFKTDVSVSLAEKLAETYNLKSTGIIINQNLSSTQYISLRYFLPGDPFRYLDASIGIDQGEIGFSNPATVDELKSEATKLWSLVFENLQPVVTSNYLEVTLHCAPDGSSTKMFLNNLVNIQSNIPELHKGFSLTVKEADTLARISVDVSDSVPDGLYVVFAYVSPATVCDMESFAKLFSTTLVAYRRLQSLARIELVEPT
jgi:hypothetical protein